MARIQCLVTVLLMALLVVVVIDSLLRWTGALARPRFAIEPAVPAPAGASS